MALDLVSLLTARSQTEVRDAMIQTMSQEGYPLTNWSGVATQRAFLETISQAIASAENNIPNVAKAGFLELAESTWLSNGNDRKTARQS